MTCQMISGAQAGPASVKIPRVSLCAREARAGFRNASLCDAAGTVDSLMVSRQR